MNRPNFDDCFSQFKKDLPILNENIEFESDVYIVSLLRFENNPNDFFTKQQIKNLFIEIFNKFYEQYRKLINNKIKDKSIF